MVFNPDITKQAIEIIFSCKNKKTDHPELAFNGIPIAREHFNLRNRNDNIPLLRTPRYKNSFFPYTIKSWKDLNEEVNKPSVQSCKKYLNDFIRPPGHSFSEYGTNLGLNFLLKSELVFQIYLITDSIIILIVKALFARVVLKMKHMFIFSYAVRIIRLNVLHSLAKYHT